MSKLAASEFKTWESLYWPDGIPREITLPDSPLEKVISNANQAWCLWSKAYSISWEQFANLVNSIAESLARQSEKPQVFSVINPDPLAMLVAATVSFKTGISTEIVFDTTKTDNLFPFVMSHNDASRASYEDFKIVKFEGKTLSWEPGEPCVSFLLADDTRVVYALHDLWTAAESFITFTDLRTERGVVVMSSSRREFGFFTSIAALIAGIPLFFIDDPRELEKIPQKTASVLFVSQDIIGKSEPDVIHNFRNSLRDLRRFFSFVGVEGPCQSAFTKRLEKAIDIPVLQMYGLSGRGIVLSNAKEFNVHGSQGIPVTNVEAIIADNYEGNWTRDRIMMGPGVKGELIIKGLFLDASKDVGDQKQNPVKASISGQSTDWTTTGIMGNMDENGYFYLLDTSFK